MIPAIKEGQGMFIVPTVVMLLIDIVLDCIAIIVMGMKLEKSSDLEALLTSGVIISSILILLLIYSVLIIISHFEEMFQQPDHVPLQKSTNLRQEETTPMDSTDNSEKSFGTIV
ncbi:uncharacterized protein TNCV_4668191 [Trichonephila clavipes]|nr:uncharacterized protein TNCV_4668191 [Trichonephila clavipes]